MCTQMLSSVLVVEGFCTFFGLGSWGNITNLQTVRFKADYMNVCMVSGIINIKLSYNVNQFDSITVMLTWKV